jgi:chorismate lyase/3-hydroxybenzoate synthase
MPSATTALPSLKIAFGTPEVFAAGVPVLAGAAVEDLFGSARPVGSHGDFALFQAGSWFLGVASVPLTAGLEEASHRLYADIFGATRGRHLVRIWNYVPAINEPGPEGLENYRLFCRGRSLAFEAHFGRDFNARLPAASAVGCHAGLLTVAFVACPDQPHHVENPLQVAAYDYPSAYGPRAPSFARATVVAGPAGATVFISGTAAIRGHATITPHSTRLQLDCTLENLQGIATACGLGFGLGAGASRHFKVYVRHAADQPMVATILQERLLTDTDRVCYLQADICRASLLVEIEVTLFGVKLR